MNEVRHFEEIAEALVEQWVEAAKAIGQRYGLQALDVEALRFMSAKMPEMAQEMLMFGFDTWPDDLHPAEAPTVPNGVRAAA